MMRIASPGFTSASEKSQISHRCEHSSSPFSASSLRYSGSNTIVPFVFTSPDCLGIPNFVGKSVWIFAIYFSAFKYVRSLFPPDTLLIWQFHLCVRHHQAVSPDRMEDLLALDDASHSEELPIRSLHLRSLHDGPF